MLLLYCVLYTIATLFIVLAVPNGQGCLNATSKGLPYCDSSLSIEKRVDDLVARLTLEELASRLSSNSLVPAIPRIGLPAINYRAEAIHGLEAYCIKKNGSLFCPSYFPITMGVAATFNRSVFYDMGRVIGSEARAWTNLNGNAKSRRQMGNSIRTPMVNILRDPRWGRSDEASSECPYLLSEFGKSVVRGVQQRDKNGFLLAVAEVKHFAVYNLETNRKSFNAVVSAFDLMDSYFPPFAATLRDAGALAYMCSYNAVNGTPACASSFLNNHTARTKWGFDGFIESDCDAIGSIKDDFHLVKTSEEATAMGINGGTDLDCGKTYSHNIVKAVTSNLTTEFAVRHAFRRAMTPIFQTGLFNPLNATPYSKIGLEILEENQKRAQSAAKQSMVLLKNNEQILPFPKNKHIALIGPLVFSRAEIFGPITIGPCPDSDTIRNDNYGGGYKGDYSCVPNLNETFIALDIAKKLSVEPGCDLVKKDTSSIPKAVEIAKSADYIVLVVGTSLAVIDEGKDLNNIKLPGSQEALIEAVAAVGKPTVVVLIMGNQMAIDHWVEKVPAVINAFIPSGTWSAKIIADTIFGDNLHFGKLPYTLYPSNYTKELPLDGMSLTKSPGRTYRYYTGNAVFPFGFGLSYTTFKLIPSTIQTIHFEKKTDTSQISIVVKNTGKKNGDEVVQLYMRPEKVKTGAPQPLRQLIDFQRIHVSTGKEKNVNFTIACKQISLVDTSGNRALFPGQYTLLVTNGAQTDIEIVLYLTFNNPIIVDSYKLTH